MQLLIVHLGALGDMLLSRPSLLAIRRHFAQAEIDLLGYPHLLSLIRYEMQVRQIYNLEDVLFTLYTNANKAFWQRYDLIAFFARRLDPDWQKSLGRTEFIFIQTVPPPGIRRPVFAYQLEQLRKYGLKGQISFVPLALPLSKDTQREGFDLLIHPGSGSPSKNWPVSYFTEVIKAFSSFRLGLIVGPADKEVAKVLLVQLQGNDFLRRLRLLQDLSLPALAQKMRNAHLFLGNDSGVTHLAAALNLPTFVIFGPTDPHRWRPWGKHVKIFAPNLACAPCEEKRRECTERQCLKAIKPKEVIETILTAIH